MRARTINEAMKIAAARAVADLTREDMPDEVAAAYPGRHLQYGPEYIIPVPFDPRLVVVVSSAVAEAAMTSGVVRHQLPDLLAYQRALRARLDPTTASLQVIIPKSLPIRSAWCSPKARRKRPSVQPSGFRNAGLGRPILAGREDIIRSVATAYGFTDLDGIVIDNARVNPNTRAYIDRLYQRLQRKGVLYRDCQRRVNMSRNIFAAAMVVHGGMPRSSC